MKRTTSKNIALLAMAALVAGCSSPDFPAPPAEEDGQDQVLKPASEYFDFVTTQTVNMQVNYGQLGSYALIDVYDENPIGVDEGGNDIINGKPIYTLFADENGKVSERVVLPAHASTVWLYANRWGIPACTPCNIENGTISYDATNTRATASRTRTATRANDQLKVYTVDAGQNLYSINPWENKYGKMVDENGIISQGKITGNLILRLQNLLWNGLAYKDNNKINNLELQEKTHPSALVTTLATEGNEDGKKVTYKEAEVWLTFISESGWNQNALGYYYYPTDKKPTYKDFPNMKKFIVFANTSIAGNTPYTNTNGQDGGRTYEAANYATKNAPMSPNTKCQLLYVDDEGNVSTKFPAGYTIGYFLITRSYKNDLTDGKFQLASLNGNVRCSESFMNSEGKCSNIAVLDETNGTVVVGFEDQVPNQKIKSTLSFEDVLFTINTSPEKIDEQVPPPSIPQTLPNPNGSKESFRTYAFEDQWPSAGDYDMNDVMVEHGQTIYFNSRNKVIKIVDTFTPCQPAGAATYHNAFAYKADYMDGSVVEYSEGVVKEEKTGAYILFADANKSRDKSFTITTTTMPDAVNKNDIAKKATDPFIIVNYKAGAENRIEVHLPKHAATVMADHSLVGTKADAYFIDKDGKHPFAIEIPLASRKTDNNTNLFTPVTEKSNIENEYPYFIKWMESNGTQNKDWYKKYKK